ncbi:DUF3519 domain-containing protein [Helicobacter pylori]|uniref:DUF3519 domain-containing protein n=1 Tax=Helicobacter pylori TaxID=210 RepID=UPI00217EF8CC|nr:DUF3519 domain-containing protein [Helicobacter pylori]
MKLPKALNEATAGAALKYHIKRALERSHSISEFSKQLELSAQKSHFSNNTLKIIEELNNGVKQASEEIKEATKTSNLVKSIREQDKRPFEVIEAKDKEAFLQGIEEKLKDSTTPLPKGMSVEEFKQTLESVENKDRFLEHLETRDNSQDRLKFLSLIEPILREPHIEIFIKDKDGAVKKEYIKAFKDENKTHLYMLITQDNDTILRTFIPKLNERYMRSHVRDADIIHSFIQPNRTANSDNALSDVVVYGDNPTSKPLIDQEDLLKNAELNNETTQEVKNLSPLEQANARKLLKLQRATTPLKEFGKNYPEFALKPKEALEKLLQEKNGQVAGAAFRDDLGGIDFVWGEDGKDGYGLAHILEKREKQYTRLGLNTEQIKERTDELLKSIPEVIENGALYKDDLGRVSVELNNIRVGLKNTWDNNNLNNHFVVTSYERDEKVLRELETKPPLSNDYKDNSNYSVLNLNENNSTKESLKNQEPPSLSILEKSQLEKENKLESERLAKAEKEYAQKIKDKEEAELRNKIRAQKNATLGKSELDREIAKSENIPYKEPENTPKTSVSLNDDEIYLLKFVIVNKSDLKPNFKNTGTQTRTAVDSKKVEEIAKRFDPKLIIGRGGFDDLPIILPDGQVIAGNHRIQGMLNFNAESRKKYEQALKENFNIRLKPNELLVRLPEQELNDKEIFKIASKSNENRANSFSDTLLSAMSSYNDKLKHLPHKFESDSVENLANQVARVLERDAKIPSANQVENANLCLLSHYATNTPNNSFLEVFDNAYKNLDREQFKAFKEMFANNSANFHNLNNDTVIKNFTISPYLTDALDTTAKMLESGNRADNFSKLAHDIDYLVNTTDENGMNAFIKENKDTYNSVISQLLGSSFARFLRLENPSVQFYEFLVKAKEQMIENAADIFTGTSKPISQINVFDFIKYGIESGKSSKESRELLNLLPELEKKFNAHEKFLQGNKK